MPNFTKFHNATCLDLNAWSTLSRNEIGPFLARFGIHPLGRKYPMQRVYEHLLGISPSDATEEAVLGAGLVRVSKVAERFGISGDDLLKKVRVPGNIYPPLYTFGPKRNLMLEAQVDELHASKRNAFQFLNPIEGHALPAAQLARTLKVPQARIDALLKDKDQRPAHIVTQGHARYIVSDVAQRLVTSGSEEDAPAPQESRAAEVVGDTREAPLCSNDGAPRGLFAEATARAGVQGQ